MPFRQPGASSVDIQALRTEVAKEATLQTRASEQTLLDLRNSVATQATLQQVLAELARQVRRENASRVLVLDLSVARTNQSLGVSGTSITVVDPGGSAWSFTLQPSANHPDVFQSTYFPAGSQLEVDFTDIIFSNPAGTGSVVLFIGRVV